MHNSQLLKLLKSLNRAERKELELFVDSPFFNTNRKCSQLLGHLLKHAPNFASPKLERHQVYSTLYNGKPYNDGVMRNLMSALKKIVLKYLAVAQFLKPDGFEEQLSLLEQLHEKKLNMLFESELSMLYEKMTPANYSDLMQLHYERMVLDQLSYGHATATASGNSLPLLQQAMASMERHYRAGKVRYLCAFQNKVLLKKEKLELEMPPGMPDFFEANSSEAIHDIKMYHSLYYLLSDNSNGSSEHHYGNLKQLLHELGEELPKGEQRQAYIVLFNYCNNRLKAGEQSHLREIFELFRMAAENGVFVENGTITPAQFFRNAVMSGLRNGELEWVQAFMESHAGMLPPEKAGNFKAYCTAALHFYKGEYGETLTKLLQFEAGDPTTYIEHKMLLCKTYYELGESEALQSLVHAYANQLRRLASLPDAATTPYKAFATFLGRLDRLRHGANAKETTSLQLMLSKAAIAEKEWLQEKLRELLGC